MNRNKPFVYSVAFLSLSIPTPGRFVFGLVLVFELLLLEVFGILSNSLATKLKFNEIRSYFVMLIMISMTILYRQIIAIAYPEIVLTIGFILFFPPVSAYLHYNMFHDIDKPLGQRLKFNIINILKFSLVLLFFFLFRDIAGYGTITFFGSNHRILEKVILNPQKIGIFMFFASIPGALILIGMLIYLFIFFRNHVIYNIQINNNNKQNNETVDEQADKGESK